MKHKLFLPFFVLIAGVLGALLRGWNLGTGYELGTGLPIKGNMYFIALLVLSGLFAVFVLLFAKKYNKFKGQTFERAFRCINPIYKILSVIFGGLMVISGLYGIYYRINDVAFEYMINATPLLPTIILCALTAFTGISIIVLTTAQSRFEISEGSAMFSLIPLFWACFDLFMTFRDNGANPVVSLYAFELIAAIAIMYAFYAMASFLFSKGNPPRFLISASFSVYLVMVSVFGGIISLFVFGGFSESDTYVLIRYVSFIACAVFLQSNIFILTSNMDYLEEIGNVDFSEDEE